MNMLWRMVEPKYAANTVLECALDFLTAAATCFAQATACPVSDSFSGELTQTGRRAFGSDVALRRAQHFVSDHKLAYCG